MQFPLVVASAALLLSGSVASAQGREPYRTSSPFQGLYRSSGIATSNDEHGIRLAWVPAAYSLLFPDRSPISVRRHSSGRILAAFSATCRTDGRPDGYSGPRPLSAELVLPMHPGDPDVPNWTHPLYWLRGLAGREFVRTPVSVVAAGRAYRSELVRHTIDYSFPRPAQTLRLEAEGVLRELAAGRCLRLGARAADTRIDVLFDAAGEPLRRAAELMLRHCRAGE